MVPELLPPTRITPAEIRSSSASDNSRVLRVASPFEPRLMSCPTKFGCKVTVAVVVSVPRKSIRSAVTCAPPPLTFAPLAMVNFAPAPNSVIFMLKPAPPSKSLAADVLATEISPVKASRLGLPIGLLTPATPLTVPTVNPSRSSKLILPEVVRRATMSASLLLERLIVPAASTARFATVMPADCETPAPLIKCSVPEPLMAFATLILLLRLYTSIALSTTAPVPSEPVVPPFPTWRVPALIVVAPL